MSKIKTETTPTDEAIVAPPFNPNKIEVRLAFLHQPLVWPGHAGTEKTLSAARTKGLKMYWTPQGLMLEVRDQRAIVPHANVINAILAE